VKTYLPAEADSYKDSPEIHKEVFAVLECCAVMAGRLLSMFRDSASVSLSKTMQFDKNIPEERRLQVCHSKAYDLAKRLNFFRRYTTISEHLIKF